MSHIIRTRIIAFLAALALLAAVLTPTTGSDGDVFVPSRIWPASTTEVSP